MLRYASYRHFDDQRDQIAAVKSSDAEMTLPPAELRGKLRGLFQHLPEPGS
jgi:hypothetical protein